MIRIDKFLAEAGLGTRSEVKKLLKSNLVSVNGQRIIKPEYKVDEKVDCITVSGKEISYQAHGYYLLHKPGGCVTATVDRDCKTVMEYLPADLLKMGYAPVGRLDKDTEGLLIITNDGELAHHLISPKHHVPKTYYVEVDQPLQEEMIGIFTEGIMLDGERTRPAKLEILGSSKAQITICEGKYHQVKRMFQRVGCNVTYLKRISMGSLKLGALPLGTYRALTDKEVQDLKK